MGTVLNDGSERVLPVPAALRPWISQLSTAAVGEPVVPVRTEVPDTATALVVRASGDRQEVVVMGPRTHAAYFEVSRVPFCVKARLRPGRARALLGVPPRGLVDRAVPLDDLWGAAGDRLAEALSDVGPDAAAVVELLEKTLIGQVSALSGQDLARDELVHSATSALTALAIPGPRRVRTTARRLNVSERHLRNLFTDAVGIPPKHFARIDRLRHVLTRASQQSLTHLAVEAGYYDQSHMTAEFRRMMGVSPGAFITGQLPAATRCR
ncbi:AraC family transcriptional regulator [Frankia nepalensis]|uniref:AraC family transcriptional regulator n=1 Tax=Frankia nepalensis TaxID=1836974 RepID=UPI0019313B2E|nr:helix-turn-helix domain-containing protein [Frankia nepalensis]